MFFVLICFLISTVMAARAHLDLQVSRYDGMEMERDLAAQGASARALVELNKDDDWKEHDSDHRVLFETSADNGRFDLEGWAQADPDNPTIYHVYGRAFSSDANGQSSISSRVVLRRPDVEGVTFTNAPIVGQYLPDSLFYKRGYDTEWTHLPPAPRMTYSGTTLVNHGGYCGSLNNLASDNSGNLYAHYIPGYDRDDVVGDIFRRKYGDFLKRGDFAGMYRAMPDYVETLGYDLRGKAFGGSVLMRFDTAKGDWEALPPVPDVGYSSGRAFLRPNTIYDGGVGPIEAGNNSVYAALFRDGHDAMLRLDLGTSEWEVIQPPGAGLPEAGQCEADEQGNLYANWWTVDRNRSGLFRKSGDNAWEQIPMPPRGQFDDQGNWQELSGSVPGLQHLDVTSDGKVYAVWNAHEENSSMEYVVYEFSSDEHGNERWTPIAPAPRFTYNADGEVKRLAGAAQLVKSIAVDAEDRIISSIDEDLGIDSLAYQQGDEYIPFELLPYKQHTRDGNLVEQKGKNLEPFQATGGGFVNGSEDRYIPIYRY